MFLDVVYRLAKEHAEVMLFARGKSWGDSMAVALPVNFTIRQHAINDCSQVAFEGFVVYR